MQVKDSNVAGLKHEYDVSIAANDIEERITNKISEIAKTAALPGFRPGKVPQKVLRTKYEDAVLGEVVDVAVREGVQNLLQEKEVKPAAQPKIEITAFDKGKDLEFKISLEALPKVDDIDFSEIELERLTAEVAEEEINETLDRIAGQMKDTEATEEGHEAEKGDITVIDFVGKIDGEPFTGGTGSDYKLELGSGSFIYGFEDQLIGKKAGEEVDVKVTFPEDYHGKDLAGKDATFDVTIKEILKPVLPELNDEFAEKLGYENLEEMKNDVVKHLEEGRNKVVRTRLKQLLLDELAERYSFEVPESMLDMEFDSIWKQYEDAKADDLLDEEDKDKTEEELKEEYKKIAERRVRLGLVLSEIGMKNDIKVSNEEAMQAAFAEASRFPGQEQAVLEYIRNNPGSLEALKAPIYEEKTVDFILEQVKTNDKVVSMEELHKAVEDADRG